MYESILDSTSRLYVGLFLALRGNFVVAVGGSADCCALHCGVRLNAVGFSWSLTRCARKCSLAFSMSCCVSTDGSMSMHCDASTCPEQLVGHGWQGYGRCGACVAFI